MAKPILRAADRDAYFREADNKWNDFHELDMHRDVPIKGRPHADTPPPMPLHPQGHPGESLRVAWSGKWGEACEECAYALAQKRHPKVVAGEDLGYGVTPCDVCGSTAGGPRYQVMKTAARPEWYSDPQYRADVLRKLYDNAVHHNDPGVTAGDTLNDEDLPHSGVMVSLPNREREVSSLPSSQSLQHYQHEFDDDLHTPGNFLGGWEWPASPDRKEQQRYDADPRYYHDVSRNFLDPWEGALAGVNWDQREVRDLNGYYTPEGVPSNVKTPTYFHDQIAKGGRRQVSWDDEVAGGRVGSSSSEVAQSGQGQGQRGVSPGTPPARAASPARQWWTQTASRREIFSGPDAHRRNPHLVPLQQAPPAQPVQLDLFEQLPEYDWTQNNLGDPDEWDRALAALGQAQEAGILDELHGFRQAATFDPNGLTYAGEAGGTHGAKIFHHPVTGQDWLIKHPPPGQEYLANVDVAANHIAAQSGVDAPETFLADAAQLPDMGTGPISAQVKFPAQAAFPNGQFDIDKLSDEDLLTIQKHHALDWLISNHDSHPGGFIRTPQGKLIGVDKGQAFKYFPRDALGWNFHPNKAHGEIEPVYNTLYRNFAKGGRQILDPRQGALGAYIQGLQNIPDEEYADTLRPYAEAAAKAGFLAYPWSHPGLVDTTVPSNDVDAFLKAAIARKNALMHDFGYLYDHALAYRTTGMKVATRVWYHSSPQKLPVGTRLTPGGGPQQVSGKGWGDHLQHVWLTDKPNSWRRYLYRVEPEGRPQEWEGGGFMAPAATIVELVNDNHKNLHHFDPDTIAEDLAQETQEKHRSAAHRHELTEAEEQMDHPPSRAGIELALDYDWSVHELPIPSTQHHKDARSITAKPLPDWWSHSLLVKNDPYTKSDHTELASIAADQDWDSLLHEPDNGRLRVHWVHPNGRNLALEFEQGHLAVAHGWHSGQPAQLLRSPDEVRRFMTAARSSRNDRWDKPYAHPSLPEGYVFQRGLLAPTGGDYGSPVQHAMQVLAPDGQVVGKLHWSREDQDDPGEVAWIWTHPDPAYAKPFPLNSGIATTLYHHVKELEPSLHPGHNLTPEGEVWAEALGLDLDTGEPSDDRQRGFHAGYWPEKLRNQEERAASRQPTPPRVASYYNVHLKLNDGTPPESIGADIFHDARGHADALAKKYGLEIHEKPRSPDEIGRGNTYLPAYRKGQWVGNIIIEKPSDLTEGPMGPHPSQYAYARVAAAPDLTQLQDTGKNLGSHGSRIFRNPVTGEEWLFKKPNYGNEFLVPLDVATAQLQQMVGLPTAETYALPMRNYMVSAVKMHPPDTRNWVDPRTGGQQAWKRSPHLGDLSPEDLLAVQKHHVLDWLIANHDAHVGNWLYTPEHGLVAVDKGQALKYLGQDRLDWKFHPNYYARSPIHNRLWHEFASGAPGELLDPREGELGDFVAQLQNIPDWKFRQMFAPYAWAAANAGRLATGAYGSGDWGIPYSDPNRGLSPPSFTANDPGQFLDALVARKNNLSNDLGAYYDKAATSRAAALLGKEGFAEPEYDPPPPKPWTPSHHLTTPFLPTFYGPGQHFYEPETYGPEHYKPHHVPSYVPMKPWSPKPKSAPSLAEEFPDELPVDFDDDDLDFPKWKWS